MIKFIPVMVMIIGAPSIFAVDQTRKLLEAVTLPIVIEGKSVGSMKISAGETVCVVSDNGTNAVIKRGDSDYNIASSALEASPSSAFSPSKSDANIYVSPKGSDSSDGSREHPFATLARARDAARSLPKEKGITVWIAGGDYLFGESLKLTAKDSGKAGHPVIWRAVEGQTVRLLGGRKLSLDDFQPITDPATLGRIPQHLRGKIVMLDLDKLGIKNIGPFRDVFEDSEFHAIPDLFYDGKRLPLARYPKTGYLRFEKVLDNAGGPTDWRNPAASVKKVDPNGPGGTFVYRAEDASRFEVWKRQLDRGVWLRGYWRVPWVVQGQRVAAIDPAARTATFVKPIPGGIGNKYTRPDGNGREPYWLTNLLEEISEPGEWCIDFKDRKIYLYLPVPQDQNKILLADEVAPVITLDGASHVVIRGLTVEGNHGDGIRISGGEGNLVAGCTVANVDKYAVVVDGGKNHTVLSNDLYHLGEGGVWLGGGNEVSVPRVLAGHRVVNNHIHDFSEQALVYAPAVNVGFTLSTRQTCHHTAVGMYVAHNLIHDTPHGGILFGSMDSVFEFNEIFRWCLVSDDMGAFYGCDARSNNFGNITFRYNFMHDSRIGDGFYFDLDHPNMKLIGNIVDLHSEGNHGSGFLFNGGMMRQDGVSQSYDCNNNVALNCKIGFKFATLLPHQGVIADNVAIKCVRPFVWENVNQGKDTPCPSFSTGTNLAVNENPGFRDPLAFDFRIKPFALIAEKLPRFQPIPVEKIGLYMDEYRRSLPLEKDLDRAGKRHPQDGGLDHDILDRPQH
jgi:parallel beta-helix repeat protein